MTIAEASSNNSQKAPATHITTSNNEAHFSQKKISPHRFLNFTWSLPPERGHVGWCTPKAEHVPGMTKKQGFPLTCSCSSRSTPRRRACTWLRPRRRRIAAGRRGGTAATPAARRGGSGSRTGSPPGSHPSSLTRRRTRRRRRKGPPGPPAPRAAGPGRTRRGRPGPGSASDSGFLKRRRVRIRPVPLRSK